MVTVVYVTDQMRIRTSREQEFSEKRRI